MKPLAYLTCSWNSIFFQLGGFSRIFSNISYKQKNNPSSVFLFLRWLLIKQVSGLASRTPNDKVKWCLRLHLSTKRFSKFVRNKWNLPRVWLENNRGKLHVNFFSRLISNLKIFLNNGYGPSNLSKVFNNKFKCHVFLLIGYSVLASF